MFKMIDGVKYKKIKSLWNGNLITEKREVNLKTGVVTITPEIPEFHICDYEDWIMIDGIEYERVR